MNRRSITIVVVIVLCAVGFAYGQGWLHWSRTAEIESNKDSAHQAMNQEKVKEDVVHATQQTAAPADTVTQ